MDNIYLDYAATTPLDPRVLEVMLPYFGERFGNPSSVHLYGQQAEAAVESAREIVADVLNCHSKEVIFTSGGSESDNLALRGVALAQREIKGAKWVITSRGEHHAVSKTAEQLEKYYGFGVEWLRLDEFGMVTPECVAESICDETAIVSVMYANNEIGTINPIRDIADICKNRGVLIHTDAVQAAAYLPVDVRELNVDLLSLGGHKFYGPKGVGALYIREGVKLISAQTGGSQESGQRAGTQNVPYIVGFAEALRLSANERDQRAAHVKPLRDHLIGAVLEQIPDSMLTGSIQERLPQHASFAFKNVDGNFLLTLLDAAGFACSSGSACKTGNPEPSEVMSAIGLSRDWGLGSLRITLGAGTTQAHVESLINVLPNIVQQVRELNHGAGNAG
jgi:cysteine desulfurase